MSVSDSNREVEIKLRISDADAGREMLERSGLKLAAARVFEHNILFDTEDLRLRSGRKLLRLRQVGESCWLTFKGPPEEGRHKSREELEVKVGALATMIEVFERLGYRPTFRYEKFRTEYTAGDKGGVVTLDETPIGCFLEIEGAPEWIDAMASNLGFREADYLTASYASLYFAWCEQAGVQPADMVFDITR